MALMWTVKFLELLGEKRRDNGLNELISIGTCSLHMVNRAFQNAENSTIWNIKELVCGKHNILSESPSRRADYERISSATKQDYPLFLLLRKSCFIEWRMQILPKKSSENMTEACSSSQVLVNTFKKQAARLR